MPGRPRNWLANIRADPRVTFHLKGPITADLPATAREITEPTERRRVMEQVARNWQRTDVDRMMSDSPLIEGHPGYVDRLGRRSRILTFRATRR